jgi:hypothetical protein
MPIKTSVKVISLYDLIANNTFLIFATLHHIIILAFNSYSIEHLDHFKLLVPEEQVNIELIQLNLEICQVITIFTAFIIFLIYNFTDAFKHRFTLEQLRFGTMIISYLIKLVFTLYQLHCNYDKEFYKNIYNEKNADSFIVLIELSYMFSIIAGFGIFIITIACLTIICIDKCIPYVNHFAKNYKITYTECILVENVDDV